MLSCERLNLSNIISQISFQHCEEKKMQITLASNNTMLAIIAVKNIGSRTFSIAAPTLGNSLLDNL